MQPFKPQILLSDNEDSFTWNLVQLFEESGAAVTVKHPSSIQKSDLSAFHGLILSPGPGLPDEMRGLMNILSFSCGKLPLLGVCLGHQAIAMHFGAQLFRMSEIIHGHIMNILITENEHGIFTGLEREITVGLYHSWVVDPETLPKSLVVTSISYDNIVMGIRHRELPIFGVQFHPESYMTSVGKIIAGNWLNVVKSFYQLENELPRRK